jgi:hypothetical protein|tara:strand:+ start:172 stop:621 length:450 start_codon:yes stop_codon:yes gene_type:complete
MVYDSEYKTIKQTRDELNYLKEEHQAEFELILSKRVSTIAEDGEELDYHYELFNEYQLNDPNDLEKKINQILSNKNLIAILEKDTMFLEIYYTTSARKNYYKPEYIYTNLGYTDIFLFSDEDKPEVEEFCIYNQTCWDLKANNNCNCCY